ncbi:hypothetical protein ACXZ1M_18760 [Duganella sp. PWIR1]
MKFLNIAELRAAYALGEISSVTLFADVDIFEIRIVTAKGMLRLALEQGVAAGFRDPGEALLVLSEAGITEVNVDTGAWHPNLKSPTRDEWLTRKVEASMAGLQDGSNRVFSEEEWMAIRAAKKASHTIP